MNRFKTVNQPQNPIRLDFSRDSKRRCMHCGAFSPGAPLCDDCTEKVMNEVEARRWRMQAIFYFISFLGALSYYLIL